MTLCFLSHECLDKLTWGNIFDGITPEDEILCPLAG